jgi:hypothetical protein
MAASTGNRWRSPERDLAVNRAARGLVTFMAGTLTFLVLHLTFVLAWRRLFLPAPWSGYEESARRGLIEPWFINTPRSLWLTRVAFFALAFVIAFARRRGRWPAALLLWAGAGVAVIATYATTSMPALPSGELGYIIYPFRLLLPVVFGTALAELLLRIRSGTAGPHASDTESST